MGMDVGGRGGAAGAGKAWDAGGPGRRRGGLTVAAIAQLAAIAKLRHKGR